MEQLIRNGKYDITMFNRGRSNPELFPEIKRIKGDRLTDDMGLIAKQEWDCILDICCYYPLPFRKQLEEIKGKVGRYVLVSTGSSYALDGSNEVPISEDGITVECSPEQAAEESLQSYNEKKAECDRILLSQNWLDKIILRPGLIVGPYDYTNRLYHWFHRVLTQDAMLIPEEGRNLVSYSDVDDFAAMLIRSIDSDHKHEVYNGNSYNVGLSAFVEEVMKQSGRKPQLVNIDKAGFDREELNEWTSLPLWLSEDVLVMDNQRIKEDFGLKLSSVAETTARLLDFYQVKLAWQEADPKNGAISLERERDIMDRLRKS